MTSGPGATPKAAGKLHHVTESLSDLGHAVVGLDRAGRIVSWNQRAASLTGWAPETATGRPFYDLLVGRARLELADGLAAVTEGRRWHAALDLEGPRGRTLRVEFSAEPVELDGTVQGAAGVMCALSPAAQDRRLHELSVALRTVPDAVLVVDDRWHVTEWNPAAEELLGWSRVEMLGVPATQLVSEQEQDALLQRWEDVVSGRVPAPAPYETSLLDRHGRRREISVQAAGYRENGAFAGAVVTFHEMSARQRDDRILVDLIADVPVVLAAYDGQACVTLAAGGGCLSPGVATWAVLGSPLLSALPEDSGLRAAVADSLRGLSSHVQVRFDERVWQFQVAPAAGGGTLSAVDVTGEKVLVDRLRAVFAVAPLAFVAFDASGRTTYVAGSVLEGLDIDVPDPVGVSVLEVCRDDAEVTEALLQCLAGQRVNLVVERDGRVWDLHLRSYVDRSGRVTGGICVALVQDATASPDVVLDLPPQVTPERDELTGLIGRKAFELLVNGPLQRGLSRAVAVLDLDAYSLLGETYGVDSAGVVLRVVADRLVQHCPPAVVGRWTDDAFAVVLDGADARTELAFVLDEAMAAIALPVDLPSGRLHVTVGAGAAASDQVPLPDLLEAAERALQRARADGSQETRWYSQQMRPVRAGVRLVQQLKEAVDGDQLRLHFQPLVSIDTRTPVAVEALVRWEHPTEGLLLPPAFMPTAERTGLVHELGRWVTTAACLQAVALAEAGTPLRVALNISARQLMERELLDMLTEVADSTGCPLASLTVEVTETAVMADLDAAVATLERLKELGVGLALDDFGTGYSSLLYLRHFPVDTLKIDRSFVSGLGVSPEDTAIVASTISLGHSVGVQCVAEGVETLAQLELLRSMGCDVAQGYLFSRALPGEQLSPWLADQTHGSPRRELWAEVPSPEGEESLQMHAEGASLHTIAAALNLAGRRTDRGTLWRAPTVATVVANWAYPALGRDRL